MHCCLLYSSYSYFLLPDCWRAWDLESSISRRPRTYLGLAPILEIMFSPIKHHTSFRRLLFVWFCFPFFNHTNCFLIRTPPPCKDLRKLNSNYPLIYHIRTDYVSYRHYFIFPLGYILPIPFTEEGAENLSWSSTCPTSFSLESVEGDPNPGHSKIYTPSHLAVFSPIWAGIPMTGIQVSTELPTISVTSGGFFPRGTPPQPSLHSLPLLGNLSITEQAAHEAHPSENCCPPATPFHHKAEDNWSASPHSLRASLVERDEINPGVLRSQITNTT